MGRLIHTWEEVRDIDEAKVVEDASAEEAANTREEFEAIRDIIFGFGGTMFAANATASKLMENWTVDTPVLVDGEFYRYNYRIWFEKLTGDWWFDNLYRSIPIQRDADGTLDSAIMQIDSDQRQGLK